MMHKAISGALIGAGVGGGVAALYASRQRSDGTVQTSLARTAGMGAVQGGAAGALVGLVMERRSRHLADLATPRRRRDRLASRAKPVLSSVVEEIMELEDAIRPAVSSAAERARGVIGEAVETAQPRVQLLAERAAEASRPVTEVAASSAKDAATRGRKAAAKAADVARDRAAQAAERARPVVREAAASARERALDAAEAAQQRLSDPAGEPKLILVRR